MSRILLIDDNDELRFAAKDFLELEGFEVLEASNGTSGIDLALHHKPDLILCDILMKHIDGFEIRNTLKSYPDTNIIPFIFWSALSEFDDIRKGMELGADDYLVKPVSHDSLIKAINTRIEKANALQQHIQINLDEFRNRIIKMLPRELITPLNGILGSAKLIKQFGKEMPNEKLLSIAGNIENSGSRLHELISSYIAYLSEISGEHYKSDFIIRDARELIRVIVAQVSQKYERSCDLVLELENGSICMETRELSYIVRELMDNAFKFSKPGTPIMVKSNIVDDYFVLEIKDHGVGFPFEDFSNSAIGVFNQFDRNKHEQQGTGLGLVTSLLIIQRCAGDLNISNHDTGVVVQLRFPLA
jgi:CheY-like chemotaxis protein/two-component sensor histidine kinase